MNLVSLSNTSEEGGSGVKWMMWQNVTCVASLLQRRVIWGGTTWSTLARNFINVAVVTTHVVELINWRDIPWVVTTATLIKFLFSVDHVMAPQLALLGSREVTQVTFPHTRSPQHITTKLPSQEVFATTNSVMENNFWDSAVVLEFPDGSLVTAFKNLWSNLSYESIKITAAFLINTISPHSWDM